MAKTARRLAAARRDIAMRLVTAERGTQQWACPGHTPVSKYCRRKHPFAKLVGAGRRLTNISSSSLRLPHQAGHELRQEARSRDADPREVWHRQTVELAESSARAASRGPEKSI